MRLAILDHLQRHGPATATQLSPEVGASPSVTSWHLPRQWMADVEPHLEDEWRRLGGLANTRVVIAAGELARVEEEIERVLAPYVTRAAEDRPAGSRRVRLLRYVLPEAVTGPEGHGGA